MPPASGPSCRDSPFRKRWNAIYDHGAGTVIVINVLDPAVHHSRIADESVAFDAVTGIAQLENAAVLECTLKSADGATTYTEGSDYSLNAVQGRLTLNQGRQNHR